MENNRLTQDLLKQLKRIADALEKTNLIEEKKLKETKRIEKIQEKKAALELKEIQEKRKAGQFISIVQDELANTKNNELL